MRLRGATTHGARRGRGEKGKGGREPATTGWVGEGGDGGKRNGWRGALTRCEGREERRKRRKGEVRKEGKGWMEGATA